jgi:DNA-binding XRE family transcriptional regulator
MVTITESKIKFGKGMTNRQIAKLVGVTRQTVYNWKMGKTRPTQKHLMKLKKL